MDEKSTVKLKEPDDAEPKAPFAHFLEPFYKALLPTIEHQSDRDRFTKRYQEIINRKP